VSAPLRNPGDLAGRLDLARPERLLLVDAPEDLRALAAAARTGRPEPDAVEAEAIRAVKETYDGILVWREERPGSEALMTRAAKRLAEGGALWVVVAQRKVTGPRTPAIHRLSREDLSKTFDKLGLAADREVRVTAWHVAHRFVRVKR
jgi:16S rRNA G1207 methylase RsmC